MPTIRTAAGKTAPLTPTEADANMVRTVVAQATNYNVAASDNREIHELANGVVATLPTASASLTETDDFEITFKAMGASATINRNSQTIDGRSENIILRKNDSITIAMNSDQTSFIIKSNNLNVISLLTGFVTNNMGTAGTQDWYKFYDNIYNLIPGHVDAYQYRSIIPCNGVLRDFYYIAGTNGATSQVSMDIALNGSLAGFSLDVPAGDTSLIIDTTTEIVVSQGDYIAFVFNSSAGTPGGFLGYHQWGVSLCAQ